MEKNQEDAVPRASRSELGGEIEFIADFDIIQAKGINLSETGICFELEQDLPFEMKFELEGEEHIKRAHLIWVDQLPDGGFRFGLKFVSSLPEESF